MTWLELHHDVADAQYILQPLLERELTDAETRAATDHALQWLGPHNHHLTARFVLCALLGRKLSPADAGTAIAATLQWLQQHDVDILAGYVFPPLLGGRELTAADARRVLTCHWPGWMFITPTSMRSTYCGRCWYAVS